MIPYHVHSHLSQEFRMIGQFSLIRFAPEFTGQNLMGFASRHKAFSIG